MSWSRRRVLALAVPGMAVLPLAGCFKPMLAEDSAASGLRGQIALPEIVDRFDYHLVQSLESRLGRPDATAYRLDVQTSISEQALAVTQDNSVTRVTLTATAEWALYRDGDTSPVLTGRANTQSGYNATGSLYATRQTRRDIERRLARDLGERISRIVLARADRVTA
ncbi:MAG: LPS assembly lipoprotein LptE [Pseudomonadota bacterium]